MVQLSAPDHGNFGCGGEAMKPNRAEDWADSGIELPQARCADIGNYLCYIRRLTHRSAVRIGF